VALWAVGISTVFMLVLWLGSKRWIPFPLGERIAWPWYSLIGSAICFGIGSLLSLRNPLASSRVAREVGE
jgi:hypothetical protein